MKKQNKANGTASEPIARYDELPILRTYKVALENIVQIGGFWVVGQDKNLYHVEMPDKVKECMWKNAKRYDIQTGKVMGYTNADRIRAMSDTELAEWLKNIRYSWTCLPRDNGNRCANFKDDCNACWLKQEAET